MLLNERRETKLPLLVGTVMWNARWLWIESRGNVLHLELIWGTPINLVFLSDISVLLVL